MKKLFFISLCIVIVVGGVVVGGKTWQKAEERARNNQAASDDKKKRAIAVAAEEPRLLNIRDRRMFSGSLKAWSVYNVAPKVSGRLLKLPFNIGDKVTGGSLIALIDAIEYSQQVDQAAADQEVAQAQLQEAEVTLELRRQEYERQVTLTQKDISSRAQFESAQTALLAQKATVAMKAAEVKRAAAVLANAKVKLSDTRIEADWSSTEAPRYIGERFVDEGALLQANQPIVSIAEIDHLRASIFVIERDYPNLKVGQHAEISTDAYPGEVFPATVTKISQLLQENSRQAHVLLEVPNKHLRLKPGMFVRVYLEFSNHENATVIPRSALIKRDGKTGVFELDTAVNKVRYTEVEPGIVADSLVEIVKPQIRRPVITLGSHLLTDGSEVSLPRGIEKAEEAQ